MAHQGALDIAKNTSEQSVSLNSALSTGYINNQGALTDLGKQGLSLQESAKFGSMINSANTMNNKEAFTHMMTQMGLNQVDINQINALRGAEKANVFSQKVATAQFGGTVNGRSFNIRTGSDGKEFNGSFDSSINVRGGYNVDMGSALGASGWAMGGVSGMRGLSSINTTITGVTGALDTVASFIPGGKVMSNVSGLTNFVTKGRFGTPLNKAKKEE